MSTLTEQVPVGELRKDDFVTFARNGEEVFAIVRRLIVPAASDRILVDYYIPGGGIGTVDLGADDLVQRVREQEAS